MRSVEKPMISAFCTGLLCLIAAGSPYVTEQDKDPKQLFQGELTAEKITKMLGLGGGYFASYSTDISLVKSYAASKKKTLKQFLSDETKSKEEKALCDRIEKIRKELVNFNLKKIYANHEDYDIAYRLLALVTLYQEISDEEMKDQIRKMIDKLEKRVKEGEGGGWGYHHMTCGFRTAHTLIPLLQAKQAGIDVPIHLIEEPIKFLKANRKPNGIHKDYGGYFRGSTGHNCVNELALYLAGSSDQKRLQWVVSHFFRWGDILDENRDRRGGHGKETVAPYYFSFAYFWASQALHFIDKDARINVKKGDPTNLVLDKNGNSTDEKANEENKEEELKSPAECLKILKEKMLALLADKAGPLGAPNFPNVYPSTAITILTGQNLVNVNPPDKKKNESNTDEKK